MTPIQAADTGEATLEARTGSILLSFVAGFVDTVGFVALFGLFTAHVTGNFVLIGAAAAGSGHASVLGKLLALPVFVLTVALTRIYQLRCARRLIPVVRPLLTTQLLFLLAFMLAGITAGPFEQAAAIAPALIGLLGVIAMSIQNTASRSVFSAMSPSTVMTGNVTQLAMDAVDWLTQAPLAEDAAKRIRKNWPPVAAFAVGALGGGFGFSALGFWALIAPITALTAAVLRVR
jgi:uncharacterized membrane protein YoaK (UPF0700 family)